MYLTMRALVLFCVASAGHAYATLRATDLLHSNLHEEHDSQKALAAALLSFAPQAAFNPSSPAFVKPSNAATHLPARGAVHRAQVSMDSPTGRESLNQPLSRRGAIATTAAAVLSAFAANAPTEAQEDNIEVYFGCGCFWHVQHEFVEAERKILKRGDNQLTALSGYAGGTGGMRDGKVCYHNAMQVSDYGSLGHAEVVGMKIPPSKFKDFASEYFALFDEKGQRPDQWGDRGLEYRNVVGIPGGRNSPLANELIQASKAKGDKLDFAIGKGSDPDAVSTAFIMDSTKFPFYQAEVYHQFHDGFNWGEDYPNAYNSLTGKLFKGGQVKDQGCPNGMLGIGIAGL